MRFQPITLFIAIPLAAAASSAFAQTIDLVEHGDGRGPLPGATGCLPFRIGAGDWPVGSDQRPALLLGSREGHPRNFSMMDRLVRIESAKMVATSSKDFNWSAARCIAWTSPACTAASKA
jgi:hypothetical protein